MPTTLVESDYQSLILSELDPKFQVREQHLAQKDHNFLHEAVFQIWV